MWRLVGIGLALVAGPALARDQYFEHSGVIYDVAVDEEGMTLTSTVDLMLMGFSSNNGWATPESWSVGRQIFHVGFDCSVESKLLGRGRLFSHSNWSGGFQLIFADGTVSYDFPFQVPHANGDWFRACLGFAPINVAPPISKTSNPPSHSFVSDNGDEYISTETTTGGVLTSVYPKSRESRLGTHWRKGLDSIYVDISCGVFSAFWGKGSLGGTNGGFQVTFNEGKEIGFPRQDLPWDKLAHCELK